MKKHKKGLTDNSNMFDLFLYTHKNFCALEMTPLEYVHAHVSISSTRKQLYNVVFNRHKNETDIENEHQRRLSGVVSFFGYYQ